MGTLSGVTCTAPFVGVYVAVVPVALQYSRRMEYRAETAEFRQGKGMSSSSSDVGWLTIAERMGTVSGVDCGDANSARHTNERWHVTCLFNQRRIF
jgi:hypothetical protein